MRTTLAIDDDVLRKARDLARRERRTVGQVVSDLARQSLQASELDQTAPVATANGNTRNGFALLPIKNPNAAITLSVVNALRDKMP